ncbi:calcium-activated potassium channel slowpoke-like isoform X3 [Acropora millepora]|uniref:calcium-activated potassium channel slowpoke-like isoform X3 n=1 Tax=Acropora millepora TaxID=45264 RepID=UPI001CF1F2CF|nr:calcium-activated potassium channel slowpoke-like isoform X3 [Acropora millepora]
MDRWSRDQPQPRSLFQRLRKAEKRDPGNEVGFTSDRGHIEIFVLLLYTFLRDSVLVTSFDTISRDRRTKQNKKKGARQFGLWISCLHNNLYGVIYDGNIMTSKTCLRAELLVKCTSDCLVAQEDRKWFYFLGTSLAIFLGGLAVILVSRLTRKFCDSKRTRLNPNKKDGNKSVGRLQPRSVSKRGIYIRLKEKAATLITAQTFNGRFLVVLHFLASILYIILFIVESKYPIEHCLDFGNQKLWLFDIAFNLFFLFYFLLRFLAANDKLVLWLEMLSLVDFLTIPEAFVSIYLRQNWLGLRFLRAMQFIRLADILQYMGIIQSSGTILLMVMFGNLAALLFTSGGIVLLVENAGDPWNFTNGQHLNYFDCLYFLVVTMSTVGFGDISAQTYFGRSFMILFISIGLGMFATYIPAILEYLSSHTVYHGSYKLQDGRKHIILCGYITKQSVETFLRDFLHKDRSNTQVNAVIMGNFLPDTELESILKKHFVSVSYFKGTVLSGEDCRRVKMNLADCCIVLCNKECIDPNEEDAENIMRVVAIKNYYPAIRIIIQLLQYQNKSYLLNIPSWNPKYGDDVVCISELKLGFIAQSCLSPGFSTLLANVFSMRSNDTAALTESEQWKASYIEGANLEMYTETLASSFKGMGFRQVAETCFEKLGLLLIAIETITPEGEKIFAINPLDKLIEQRTRGYFIAGSSTEVKRAYFYCQSCHANVTSPEQIKECQCLKGSLTFRGLGKAVLITAASVKAADHRIPFPGPKKGSEIPKLGTYKVLNKLKALKEQQSHFGEKIACFDISGTFYWCEPKRFDDQLLTRVEAMNIIFSHHILICVFNDKDSPSIGLRPLVIPLRASNLLQTELKKIVFVGNKDYMQKEWHQLCNFEDVYVLPGSPFCRADLRAVNANLADMVVFLSPSTASKADDPKLADKESILASLNLKAMSFDDGVGMLSESARSAFSTGLEFNDTSRVERRGSAYGCNVPIITEVAFDQNVQYLDIDDEDVEDQELYLTQPFACGTAFTVSMLDSLMSATYFNPDILTLVRNLVTGGVNQFLEEHIAEGDELRGGLDSEQTADTRSRCKILQLSLFEGPLAAYGDGGRFGELFLHALRTSSMICLGLYRFRDSHANHVGVPSAKRFVICSPPYTFKLQQTDLVFVLAHSDPQLEKFKS